MALFEIIQKVPLPPPEAWRRITSWERHGDAVPLTTIRRTDDGFVARTAVGPWGFDDVMVVTRFAPPVSCRLEKRGRVVLGWAEIEIEACAQGSRVTWREDVHVRGVPRILAPAEAYLARMLFRFVMKRLLAGPVPSGHD